MDRGIWQTTVHRITMNQTELKWLLAHKALGCSTLTFFTKLYTVSPLKLILHLRVVLVVVYVIIFSLICIQSPMPSYIWCLFSLLTKKLAHVNLTLVCKQWNHKTIQWSVLQMQQLIEIIHRQFSKMSSEFDVRGPLPLKHLRSIHLLQLLPSQDIPAS